MTQEFCIWIVSPAGYLHSRCFEEVALALSEAFAALGFEAPIVTDPARIRGRAVVLGANLLAGAQGALPPGLILYNLEQVQADSPWLTPGYIALLKRYPLWDYSARNIAQLEAHGVRAALCGIGYMQGLTRIQPAAEDVDVVFIGSMNPRRYAVLDQVARAGKKVAALFNSYGEERDRAIARARLVLNVHFYEAQVFEMVRVSYLLANRKCVVSETGFDAALEAPLREGVAFAPYERLAERCLQLLENEEERKKIAAKGFERFSALSQVPMLKRALESLEE